jgi:hypothetical protein
MARQQWQLGEPQWMGSSDLQAWLSDARQKLKVIAPELVLASEELRAVLAHADGGSKYLLGTDQRVRARIVSAHLAAAGEHAQAMTACVVRTWASYQKHFVSTEVATRRATRKFDVDQ